MTNPQILIACVGNIFLGDDGFGVEVARRLALRTLPPGVVVRDFGIRGFDLMFALLDARDLTILVDAYPRGGDSGTVYLVEPELAEIEQAETAGVDMHGMNPMRVLRMAHSMGGVASRVVVVGCEPKDLGTEAGKLGLTNEVQAAVDEAAALIETLVKRILEEKSLDTVLQAR